jgi:hypothetical protein
VNELQISGVVVTAWQRPCGVSADDIKWRQCCANDCEIWCSSLLAVCAALTVVMGGVLAMH